MMPNSSRPKPAGNVLSWISDKGNPFSSIKSDDVDRVSGTDNAVAPDLSMSSKHDDRRSQGKILPSGI